MADLYFAASYESSLGLKIVGGILMSVVSGVVVSLFCVWRKPRVKKMRKLPSSFFRRKQQRIEKARRQQIRSPKSNHRTEKNNSKANLKSKLQSKSLEVQMDNEACEKNLDSVNGEDDLSTVPTSTDAAHLNVQKAITAEEGRVLTNSGYCGGNGFIKYDNDDNHKSGPGLLVSQIEITSHNNSHYEADTNCNPTITEDDYELLCEWTTKRLEDDEYIVKEPSSQTTEHHKERCAPNECLPSFWGTVMRPESMDTS